MLITAEQEREKSPAVIFEIMGLPNIRNGEQKAGGGSMNKTTAQYLANAFKAASLRVTRIRKAAHTLAREGLEIDWDAQEQAIKPHSEAMDEIARTLLKSGWEIGRFFQVETVGEVKI